MRLRLLIAVLFVILLFVLSTVSSPVALGQNEPLFVPPEPAPSTTTENTVSEADDSKDSTGAQPVLVRQSKTSPCDEQHWIVSIRRCRECCPQCAWNCQFDYIQSDREGNAVDGDEAGFQNWLQPGVPICILIHGSFFPAADVPGDCRTTFRFLREAAPDRALHVVCFTWSSEGIFTINPAIAGSSPVPGIDVAILGRRAETNGIRLARLIRSLPPESPVCLIGHSHGARIAASGLNLLGGGHLNGFRIPQDKPRRIRTVLAAAAIDHDWLCSDQRYGHALCATECLLNMQNKYDWALGLYPLRRPFSRSALGQVGFTRNDIARMGPHGQHVMHVDISPWIGFKHVWPYYCKRPEIGQMLVPWVYFTK